MSKYLNKAFKGKLSLQVEYLLTFIKENGLQDSLDFNLATLIQEEEIKPDVYKLEAHSDKVTDLPLVFMQQLRGIMLDISYCNDDAARFTALHEDGDKAYHLWIGHADKAMREPFEPRFSLSIVGLDDYDTGGDDDFAGHLTMDTIKSIIDTDSIGEISAEISKLSLVFAPKEQAATNFIMQVFNVPKEIKSENITINNSNILSWELLNVGLDNESGEFVANIRFHTFKPATVSDFDSEISLSSNIHEAQGVDIFITCHPVAIG